MRGKSNEYQEKVKKRKGKERREGKEEGRTVVEGKTRGWQT